MASILDLGAAGTARAIAKGDISAVEAVEARIARIESVNKRLNAVVWKRYDSAIAEARVIDGRRRAGEPLGPLAGVGVTIKECIDFEGSPSTFGLPSRKHIPASATDPHVDALRRAGAVVIGKTNVAQMLLFVETDNPLYGRTNNPWALNRSPGGSSGGEGAIIAARGSCLGLGTDIGGSVRAPAHMCGVASIKPTAGRCPDRGRYSYPIGQQAITSQLGLIACNVEDLTLGLAAINGASSIGAMRSLPDPSEVDLSRIRIGWYANDGLTPAAAVVQRAVREAAAALSAAGADLVEWTPPDIAKMERLYYSVMTAGGTEYLKILGRDRADARIAQLLRASSAPHWLSKILAGVLQQAGQTDTARIVSAFGSRSAAAYWRLLEELSDYRDAFALAMEEAGIDAILTPTFSVPAFSHGATKDPTSLGSYTILFNVLGFPAGSTPWTTVRKDEAAAGDPRARNLMRKTLAGSAGLPIGVQLAAPPWREDVVLAAMAALETAARRQAGYPHAPPI